MKDIEDLISRRESLGIGQSELAERADVSARILGRLERGEQRPESVQYVMVERISHVIGASVEETYSLIAAIVPRKKAGNPNLRKGKPRPYEVDSWKYRRKDKMADGKVFIVKRIHDDGKEISKDIVSEFDSLGDALREADRKYSDLPVMESSIWCDVTVEDEEGVQYWYNTNRTSKSDAGCIPPCYTRKESADA